jgi:porphobilinogen synthase
MAERSRSPVEGPYPSERLRRLRRRPALRDWIAETDLPARRLVYPVFVGVHRSGARAIPSLPDVSRYAVGEIGQLASDLADEHVASVLLFGAPRRKSVNGQEAWSPGGVVPAAVRAIKDRVPEMVVATDVCLCAYTTHGHCGLVTNGHVDNDRSVEALGRVALTHARAGADLVAPSAMMDHQVAGIRNVLDRQGFPQAGILAYSTKHASAFYGPFREAEGSAPAFGDRASYQLDPRNAREAMRELEADAVEGADILMVKPALTSLDLLARARQAFRLPLAAYQVSGEYAMLRAAAQAGIVDGPAAIRETLLSIRRAGADLIVTYFAREVARAGGYGA